MPTVQIWLTGVSIVSSTIQVYRNPITPTNHGTFITTVTKNCLTIDKPCEITIPDGTTKLRLLDFATYCYWDIPICDNNICANCSIGYANVINNQIGRLNVGNMTSTCDSTVDNYVVDWYGPNDPNLLRFTAGKGSLYSSEYTNEYPLIGATSPLLPPGTYVAKIRKVELNGIQYSRVPTPGHVSADDLINCSLTQNINGLTCSNGTTPLTTTNPYFTHFFSYTATSPGVIPQGVETNFILNAGQQYLIYEFEGKTQPDTFEVKLMRNPPITLESIKVGNTISDSFIPTLIPKQRGYSWFRKIINLSQFNIQANEFVNLKVTPNPVANVTTDWSLGIGCYSSFNITKPCLDTYRNQPYRIQKSSITATTNNCSITVSFKVSGCSKSDNLSFRNSEFGRFITGTTRGSTIKIDEPSDNSNLINVSYTFQKSQTNLFYGYGDYDVSCTQLTPSQTVRIIKYASPEYKLRMEFQNATTLSTYYNQAVNAKSSAQTTGAYPFTTNNSQIGYYKFIYFKYISSGINFGCQQENLGYNEYPIHASCTILSGITSGVHWMEISVPQVTYNLLACTSPVGITCYQCYLNGYEFSRAEQFRNVAFNNFYPLGIITPSAFGYIYPYTSTTPISLPYAYGFQTGRVRGETPEFMTYSFKTFPFDASNNPLPAFNAEVFDVENYFKVNNTNFDQTFYSYQVTLTSENPIVFTIEGAPISNFAADYNTVLNLYNSNTPNAPINPIYMY
jgi:hypothetical protein